MWWKEDSWVSERLDLLVSAREMGELPSVTVLGSTWDSEGERTLFVGIHPTRDPRPWAWMPGKGLRARLGRRLIRRFGPLPYPGEKPWLGGGSRIGLPDQEEVVLMARLRPSLLRVLTRLVVERRHPVGLREALLLAPMQEADELTQEELARFELPATTRVGYVGPIRPVARKGRGVFKAWSRKRTTLGWAVRSKGGVFLTTAGHLGAQPGELVYKRQRRFWSDRNPWGEVVATTCPEDPDGWGDAGLDIAAIASRIDLREEAWEAVRPRDPRLLRHHDYVRWNGGVSGLHEGWVVVPARVAEGIEDVDYEHALMVIGNPPRGGGAEGDSGAAVFDEKGRLLGHLVGIDGARDARGIAPVIWFQMIDVAIPYLEHHCGEVREYLGEGR